MQLSYVSIVTERLDELKACYVAALGLDELTEWSHEGFRALLCAPGVVLALHSPEAYKCLGLEPPGEGQVGTVLTFDPGSADELQRLHNDFVARSVPVIRAPFETQYGSLQAIYRDIDGNPFRLNTFDTEEKT